MQANSIFSDEQLFERLRQGDSHAFTEIYNRYWHKLYLVASNKLNNGFLAQEVVQELFVDIWRRREGIQVQKSAAIYLAAALKYKVINARIKQKKERDRVLQLDDHSVAGTNNLSQSMSFTQLQRDLEKWVVNLPDKSRLIYKMSREDGFTHKEIAGQLEISEKTVEYHLTRALKILRQKLLDFTAFRMELKNMFNLG